MLLALMRDDATVTERRASRRKSEEFLTEVAMLREGALIIVSARMLKSLSHKYSNDVHLRVILFFFVVADGGLMVVGLYNSDMIAYQVL